MSYAEKNLLPGEQVVYRTGLHWVVLLAPITFLVLSLAFAVWAMLRLQNQTSGLVRIFGFGLLGVAVIVFLIKLIYYRSAEFAVTSKRVMLKVGWASRHSLELILSKVEAISVDQDLRGRVLGYGTITVTGTGGTKETFETLARPFEFRSQVQGQIR
ncbi:MAG: PH domain-containing protein [Acidobacteriota bacterium]